MEATTLKYRVDKSFSFDFTSVGGKLAFAVQLNGREQYLVTESSAADDSDPALKESLARYGVIPHEVGK